MSDIPSVCANGESVRVRREYFPLLDGIRGLAAIAIMYRHMGLFGVAVTPQSYLAVDLFFLLSGAVIANAYEDRLRGGMGAGDFLVRRVIRLYPMIVIGVVLGAVMCLLGAGAPGQREHLLSIVALSLIVLPDNPLVPLVGNLNGPAWSLFYEMLVNAAYALGIRRLSGRALAVICAISAVILCVAAGYKGHLDTGYTPKSFVFGLGRVGFSFFAGVALYRLHVAGRLNIPHRLRGALGAAVAVALLALTMLVSPATPLRPFLALASVFFIFPAIVMLGLASELDRRAQRICRVLGEVSYPLYLIHFPLIQMVGGLLIQHHLHGLLIPAAVIFGPVAMALAWALDRWVDGPVRKRLTRLYAALRSRFGQPRAVLSRSPGE